MYHLSLGDVVDPVASGRRPSVSPSSLSSVPQTAHDTQLSFDAGDGHDGEDVDGDDQVLDDEGDDVVGHTEVDAVDQVLDEDHEKDDVVDQVLGDEGDDVVGHADVDAVDQMLDDDHEEDAAVDQVLDGGHEEDDDVAVVGGVDVVDMDTGAGGIICPQIQTLMGQYRGVFNTQIF